MSGNPAIPEVPADERESSRDEILAAARLAGRDLPAPYQEELVEAFGHVRRLVALLPRALRYGDEPAHIFDPTRFGPGGA